MSASVVQTPSKPGRPINKHPTFNIAANDFHTRQPSFDFTAAAEQGIVSPGSERPDRSRGESRRTSGTHDRPGLSYQGVRQALPKSVFDDYDPRESLMSRQAAQEKRIKENQARKQSLHERAVAAVATNDEKNSPQETLKFRPSLRGGDLAVSSTQQVPPSTPTKSKTTASSTPQLPGTRAADARKEDREIEKAAAEDRRPAPPPRTAAKTGEAPEPVRKSSATPGKYGKIKPATGMSYTTAETTEAPLSVPTPSSWNYVSPAKGVYAQQSGAPVIATSDKIQQVGERFRQRVEQATPGRLPVEQAGPISGDIPAASLRFSNAPSKAQQPSQSSSMAEGSASMLLQTQITPPSAAVQQQLTQAAPAAPLIDVSTPKIGHSLEPTPPAGGLAEVSSSFLGGIGRAMAAFRENQKAPARATATFPNQEHVDYFAAYPKPEKREGPRDLNRALHSVGSLTLRQRPDHVGSSWRTHRAISLPEMLLILYLEGR